MAKRKRLTPARSDYLDDSPAPDTGLETKSMFPLAGGRAAPPIAQVAGDAAARAAVEELSGEIRTARAEGRLVQALPLGAIEETHLVRDRMVSDPEEMAVLVESLRARGQQTPIEVVELDEGRFGLISGWRRLAALRALHTETGDDRFATVQALLRRPESASDAYLAMVEENEIRVGLSYYERARIAAKAAEQGVFESEKKALLGLFAAASRAKRSKIRSYIDIYHALDGHLRFASTIPERLGLMLSKALKEDAGAAAHLVRALQDASAETPEAEATALTRGLKAAGEKPASSAETEPDMPPVEVINGVRLALDGRRGALTLSGPGLSPELLARLRRWLRDQG